MHLWLLWRLVGCADTRELFDLARSGLFVQTFGVTSFSLLNRHVDEHLDEGERRVVALDFGVEVARDLAVGFVGRYEGGQGNGCGVGEEFGDLGMSLSAIASPQDSNEVPYLSNPPNVLFTVFGREAQVLVQTEAHIVAVQSVCRKAKLEEMLLESDRNRRLSRRREASEPDGAALLLSQVTSLRTCQACVPCDVAVLSLALALQSIVAFDTYVAMSLRVLCESGRVQFSSRSSIETNAT